MFTDADWNNDQKYALIKIKIAEIELHLRGVNLNMLLATGKVIYSK